MQLTEHFSYEELRCPCCKECKMNPVFMTFLEGLRQNLGRPFIINSGFRCFKYNQGIGGKTMSRHTHGMAVDLSIIGWIPEDIHYLLFELTSFDHMEYSTGIGVYKTHIHIDLRKNESFWIG